MSMQLPDETVEYDYRNLLLPHIDAWTPLAELQSAHFLPPDRLEALRPQLMAVRSRIATEREVTNPSAKDQPIQAGFIDLPQKLLDNHRRRADNSELGRILHLSNRLRENVDRVVVLGIGGSYLGAKALFDALCHTYHNEMPTKARLGKPRIYFEGNNLDNDALQDLLELFENTCVDPELAEERWGVIVVSKSGGTIETAAALRVFRSEAAKYYGNGSDRLKKLFIGVTGPKGRLRDLLKNDGFAEEDILNIPDDVGGRYSVFTSVGLLPAATMGLDVRALLLGAASMTRRFLEEPLERNPVLQFAAINYLMTEEFGKKTRVLSVWSRKLESLGFWYDQLLAESLGKLGRGATPITVVNSRDLHSRGQQHQEGTRDKMINNLYIKNPHHPPIPIGHVERNEDDLNVLARKGYPDLLQAAIKGTNQAYAEVGRPTADIIIPLLSEHTMGQLMQMLMLATVVEGRLMNINPYGQPGVESYKRNMQKLLKDK